MPDPKYTEAELDHYRQVFRNPGKGTTHVPVQNGQAGKVADMLDDLAERRRESHCKACGEPSSGPYCPDHA